MTSTVLLGGGLIVTSWTGLPDPPVANAPSAPPVSIIEDGLVPMAAAVDQETTRLRERLAVRPDYPEPTRNPFAFGGRTIEPAGEPALDDVVDSPQVDLPPPAPVLRLVAILSERVDGVDRYRAVLSLDGRVFIRTAGESAGELTVSRVSADGVELSGPDGVPLRRLTLR